VNKFPEVKKSYDEFNYIDNIRRSINRFEDTTQRRSTNKYGLLLYVAKTLDVSLEQIIELNPSPQSLDLDRVLIAMKGWPGVGKSTLAAVLALDREDVPNVFPDGVLWVTLGPSPDIEGGLRDWCQKVAQLTGVEYDEAKSDPRDYLKKHLRDRHMLLIIDDAWEYVHAMPFAVGGWSCGTLVTTRRNDVASDLVGSEDKSVFELKRLDEVSAFELFERLAPVVVKSHEEKSRELVTSLEGLPLAIQVAGRLLRTKSRVGWDIGKLIDNLTSRTEELLREGVPPNMRELAGELLRREGVYSVTVAALLELSIKQLSNDEVRDRFADLGSQAPKPYTFDVDDVLGLWGIKTFEEAAPTLEELINVGLIQRIESPSETRPRSRKPPQARFMMHALLVALARSLASE
jgi:NB-ARC domain